MFEPGYHVFENILSGDECDSIIKVLELSGPNENRAGLRNLMSVPEISEIASDQRLLSICRTLSGSETTAYKATLFNKTGKANWLVAWHQDTALPLEKVPNSEGWGPASEKAGVIFVHAPTWALRKILALRVHLDASTTANGPLRLIPKTHNERICTDEAMREQIENGTAVEVCVGRGGIIAMSPLIIHASSKCFSDAPRRVLHIEYAPSLDLAPEIKLAIA